MTWKRVVRRLTFATRRRARKVARARRREREIVEDRIAWQRVHSWLAGLEEPRGGL